MALKGRPPPVYKLDEDIVVPSSKLTDLAEFAEKLRQKNTAYPIAAYGTRRTANIMWNILPASPEDRAVTKKSAPQALEELFLKARVGGVITATCLGIRKARWWLDPLHARQPQSPAG